MPHPAQERTTLIVADRIQPLGGAPALDGPVGIRVRSGMIAEVGRIAEFGSGDDARIDLPGATLTPGLVDAHIHLSEWSLARRDLDLAAAQSPGDVVWAVTRHAARFGGEWIRGRGWNPHHWGGEYPNRRALDTLVPDRPVLLQSHDMHALWVNGETLRRAQIRSDTPDPEGGRIVRDDDGEPTGILLENAAQLVARILAPLTVEETAAAVAEGQAVLHAWGITGVHTLPAIHIAEPEPISVLEAVRDSGRLRLRVLQHLALRQLDDAIRIGLCTGFGGDWIRVGGVKMFLDGALGSRTAHMLEPYEGSTSRGIAVLDAGEFRFHVRRAAAAGIASTVHAIGDAAVGLAIDVLSDGATRVPGHAHRIEHVQCCPPRRFADIARGGLTASMQPGHLITDWRIADRHWGAGRAARTYALRSLLDAGVTLAFGSDAPVEPADPRLGLYAAVTRKDLDARPDGGWFAGERLSIAQAFDGYTHGPARAAGQERTGIVPGAPADFAAWSADPLTAGPDDLLGLECIATIVGGAVVHSRPS